MRRAGLVLVLLLVWGAFESGRREAQAYALPAGWAVLSVAGKSAVVTASGATVPVQAAVGGASAWGVSTLSGPAVGAVVGWGVIALAAAGTAYFAYKGWKAYQTWWNGKPTGVAGEVIRPGAGVPSGNPDKLYVETTTYDLPPGPTLPWSFSYITLRSHGPFQTQAAALAAGQGAGGDYDNIGQWWPWNSWLGFLNCGYGVDATGNWSTCTWYANGGNTKSIWYYPTVAGTPITEYREATGPDVQKAIADGVTANDVHAIEQAKGVLIDIGNTLAQGLNSLNGSVSALTNAVTGLAQGLPESHWTGLQTQNQSLPAAQQQGQLPSAMTGVSLDNISTWSYKQLTDIVTAGVSAPGAPKPLSQAETTDAFNSALANDRALRPSAVGLTAPQTQQAVEDALAQHRSAEKAEADGEALPTQPVFDPEVVAPDKKSFTTVLNWGKDALLNLPWVGLVAGMGVTASGSPVVTGVIGGKSYSFDFSPYQTTVDFMGNVLLTVTWIVWGRKLLGG